MMIGIDVSRALRPYKTGVEWYAYELLRAMCALDTTDTLRLYRESTRSAFDWHIPDHVQYRRPWWPFSQLWTLGGLSWEMLRTPPDVLFVPVGGIPLIHPARTYTTVHDVGFLAWKEAYSQKDWQYLDWSTRRAVKECREIITISEFSKGEIVAHYGADPARVKVVYLGYDQTRYTSGDDVGKGVFFADHPALVGGYMLCVGRIDVRKNQILLARAMQRVLRDFPEIKLVLIGPLGYRGVEILKEMQDMLGDALVHLGWVEEQEKIDYIRHAKGVVLPSLYEGFGLPVLEVQACGVPLLCANATSLPEVAGEGAIFFDPTSVEGCEVALRGVFAGGSVVEETVVLGKENVQRFSWEAGARETLKIISAS